MVQLAPVPPQTQRLNISGAIGAHICEFYSIKMAQCRTCIPLTLVAQQLHGLLGKSFSNSYIFNSSTDELTIFLFPEGVKCAPIMNAELICHGCFCCQQNKALYCCDLGTIVKLQTNL